MAKKIIITIDGPAASGKGELSKAIAQDLNLYYLETGIFYRLLAKEMIGRENNVVQVLQVISKLNKEKLDIELKNIKNLYTNEISELASTLAKKAIVRKFILKIQKHYLNSFSSKFSGAIIEGRDCGTVVAPDADIKIFLTAKLDVRAKRRFEQLNYNNIKKITLESVKHDLSKRDKRDKSRKLSPLKKAGDAILLDNTEYSFNKTINIVKKIIFSKIPTLKINFNK